MCNRPPANAPIRATLTQRLATMLMVAFWLVLAFTAVFAVFMAITGSRGWAFVLVYWMLVLICYLLAILLRAHARA